MLSYNTLNSYFVSERLLLECTFNFNVRKNCLFSFSQVRHNLNVFCQTQFSQTRSGRPDCSGPMIDLARFHFFVDRWRRASYDVFD